VTLSGSNFGATGSDLTVTFDGATATLNSGSTYHDHTYIEFILPAGKVTFCVIPYNTTIAIIGLIIQS
jgi:hypothetical protein